MTNQREPNTRRVFLGALGAAALSSACGAQSDATSAGAGGPGSTGAGGPTGTGGSAAGGAPGAGGAGGQGGVGGGGPLACTPSADNILGPYYRPNAPFRSDLTERGMPGTRVVVTGRVLDPACQAIVGALVDVWQADASGDYDNDGVDDPPGGEFVLRGRINTDDAGEYAVRTIVPGHYLNGAQFRPAHIHVTVSAPGFAPLTTQLYFEGDPYNAIDPWFLEELMLTPTAAGDELQAAFDFVLEPA